MQEISIGMSEIEDGYQAVVIRIHGYGSISLGSDMAVLYGKALVDFGLSAALFNDGIAKENATQAQD